MDITIQSKTQNPFLKREEIEATVTHDEGTPKKSEIQQELSKTLMVKKELIVLSKITPRYGSKQLKIKAHIYETAEAMKIEVKEKKEDKAAPKEEKKKE
jgi:ribosomal protein S24E